MERIQNFKGVSKLKQGALIMMIKMMDELLFEDMVKQFSDINKDQTYMINASELKQAFQTFKISL